MPRYSIRYRSLLLPILAVIILEIIWNLLEGFLDPSLLDIPLHLVKYVLYAIAGYIAALLDLDYIHGAIYGGITGGVGALVEGFIISLLFYGVFFYTPGFSLFFALEHIINLILTGAFFGLIGSYLRSVTALEPLAEFLRQYIE